MRALLVLLMTTAYASADVVMKAKAPAVVQPGSLNFGSIALAIFTGPMVKMIGAVLVAKIGYRMFLKTAFAIALVTRIEQATRNADFERQYARERAAERQKAAREQRTRDYQEFSRARREKELDDLADDGLEGDG